MIRRSLVIPALLLLATAASAGESVLGRLETEIREIADKAGPAVVRVVARRDLSLTQPGPGDLMPRVPEILTASSTVGTGFVISPEGLVLTSQLITRGASAAEVEFPSGEIRKGRVLGSDPFFQVALVRVDPVAGVSPLSFSGEAEVPAPSVGVFMGSPIGRERNVALAIVTSTRQSGVFPGDYDNFFVVNTPVNPGDIGGPLLDSGGRVRGMGVGRAGRWHRVFASGEGGTVRVRTSSSVPGMSFGVPAADLAYAVHEIEAHGRVRQGKLGVYMKPGTLTISHVRPESPAATAGLEDGDVFLAVDGKPLREAEDLHFVLRRTRVGEQLRLKVRRGEEEIEVASSLEESAPGVGGAIPGLVLSGTGGELRIVAVDSRLSEAGLRAGDVLVSLFGKKVESPRDLMRVLPLLSSPTGFEMEVRRGGKTIAIHVRE